MEKYIHDLHIHVVVTYKTEKTFLRMPNVTSSAISLAQALIPFEDKQTRFDFGIMY